MFKININKQTNHTPMNDISSKLKNREKAKSQKKVAFLKFKDEISSALDEGWSGYDIWSLLKEEKKISFSYQLFQRYRNRFISPESEQVLRSKPQTVSKPVAKPQPVIASLNNGNSNNNEASRARVGKNKPTKVVAFSQEKGIGSPAELARQTDDADIY